MYAPYFGLEQEPFSIAPDPRYLFMSERHREALAHLLYGVRGGGGFVLLTGEIGAGKTTVCRCFLEQIPKRCNVAYIFNPKLTVTELLKTVCDEFRIPYEHHGPGVATVKDYLDPLNAFLLRTHAVGQNNVLIIDEAQNLSADVLEQLRLLTNLETNERKLLQIVLIGQPELRTMLARPELEQLAQRVIARFHLEALSQLETAQYVRHRLAVAGLNAALPFDRDAMRRIQQLSRGVPRRINLLCDRALLGAYASGSAKVDRAIVEQAAREVFEPQAPALPAVSDGLWSRRAALLTGAAGVAVGMALFGLLAWTMSGRPRDDGAPRAALSSPVAASGAAAVPDAVGPAVASSVAASVTAAALPPIPPAAASAPAARGSAAAATAALTPPDLQAGGSTPLRREPDAWRALAAAWRLDLGDGDPCSAAARRQLQCYRGSGGLSLIRELGRPGILTLRDAADQPVYALLTGLGEDSATLTLGAVTQTVSLASLARFWRGEFATFWRAPPGYRQALAEGSSGAAVGALSTQLAALDGTAAADGADPRRFDAALRARVFAFQLAHGLKPDGIAGPTTFMQLNRASGVDEPRLHTGG